MEGGRMSGLSSRQDGSQFEDALRRLHALEKKLTDQVQVDIKELKNQWVQLRVDRVTHNTFKLWEVREQLKTSKVLYLEEERILEEFNKVKRDLVTASMDDEYFEATKDTCVLLGGKLTEVRNQQLFCYSGSKDLETAINKDIMTLRFEDEELEDLNIDRVRATTPLRQMSPTPLERHRSRSREPSPFQLQPLRLGSLGSLNELGPGSLGPEPNVKDPHAYFSRPGSSQSLHGGRGGDTGIEAFRTAMEAKQADDDSPPKERKFATNLSKSQSGQIVLRSATGQLMATSENLNIPSGSMFSSDRPASAMSDMSIDVGNGGDIGLCWPDSRMDVLGDIVSGDIIDPFIPGPEINFVKDEDDILNLDLDWERKQKEENEVRKRAEEQAKLIREEARTMYEEKERIRLEEEALEKQAKEEAKKEKIRLEKEEEFRLREERRKADEQKVLKMEKQREEEKAKKLEEEKVKKEMEKHKRLEKKKENKKRAEEAKAKMEVEEKEKAQEKEKLEMEKQKKLDEKKEKTIMAEMEKAKKDLEMKEKENEKENISLSNQETAEKDVDENIKRYLEEDLEIKEMENEQEKILLDNQDTAEKDVDKNIKRDLEEEANQETSEQLENAGPDTGNREEDIIQMEIEMGSENQTDIVKEEAIVEIIDGSNQHITSEILNEELVDEKKIKIDEKGVKQVDDKTTINETIDDKNTAEIIKKVEKEINYVQIENKTNQDIEVQENNIIVSNKRDLVKTVLDKQHEVKEECNLKQIADDSTKINTEEGITFEKDNLLKLEIETTEPMQIIKDKNEIEHINNKNSEVESETDKPNNEVKDAEFELQTESCINESDAYKGIEINESETKSIILVTEICENLDKTVESLEGPQELDTNLIISHKDAIEMVVKSDILSSVQQSSLDANKSDDGYKIDASDADDEEDVTIEKTRTKSRSVSRGRSEGKVNDSSGDEKEKNVQMAPPPKPKSRSTSRSKKKSSEVDSKSTNERSKSKSGDVGESKKLTEPVKSDLSKPKGVSKEYEKEDGNVNLPETSKVEKPKRRTPSTSRNQEPNMEDKNQQQVGDTNKKTMPNDILNETSKEESNKTLDIVRTTISNASEQKSSTIKSRSSSKTRVDFGDSKEATTGNSGSKGSSRQTSRTGSPVGILKGGKRSRDASRDRAGPELPASGLVEDKSFIEMDEPPNGKPLSRSGSLKKSSSFSKRVGLMEKKKISFDDDVDIGKFENISEPITTAKELFAAIADTSLESGLAALKQKSRSTSRERPGSRGSSSRFPQQEPREFPEGGEFEDEDELMIILDTGTSGMTNIPFQGSRSVSRERPGSKGIQQDNETNRLDYGVPELEIVEQDNESMTKYTGEVPDGDVEDRRPLSSAARPPSSTGFSHLDEFERRLAEMENELESEEVTAEDLEQNLKRGKNMWNLSPKLQGTAEPGTIEDIETLINVPIEVDDLYAKVGVKLKTKPTENEDLYAEISPNKKTDDGFVLNTDTELFDVDHSCLQDDIEEDVGSEYVFDDDTRQRIRRSKKVSFAESDERYEIERQSQAKGLGGALSKIFSLASHKPTKIVVEPEVKVDIKEQSFNQFDSNTIGERSLDQDTSARAFLSAMTGGIIGPSRSPVSRSPVSRSPEPEKKEGGSLFGALLRRGRKGSRSGSQQGSRQSSGDRSGVQEAKIVSDKSNQPIKDVHEVSEDEGKASSVTSGDNYDGTMSDAGSESSFVGRLKKLKRKKPKVQPADFDELFARGLALSAQQESESQDDPFKVKLVSEDISRTEGMDEDTFRFSQKDDGIGFAEKVTAFLDDQASNPRPSVDMEPRERGRRRHRHRGESQGDKTKPETGTMSRSQSDDKRKRSREYTKPEDIKLSPQVPRDLYTGEQLTDNPTFLAKVTEFVTNNEVDCQYTQQIWPAIPGPDDKLPPLKDPDTSTQQTLDRISPLPGLTPPSPSSPTEATEIRLAPSPGKAFLEAVTGLEAFGPSIEGAPDDDIKIVTNTLKVAEYIQSNYGVSMGSPPRDDEPADKGLPLQLIPDKLMANEDFYEKLRSGLKDITTPERLLEEQIKDETENYQAYSHHLGRAEFGSLQRKKTEGISSRASAATSRDPSGDKLTGRTGLSHHSSGDKLNLGALSRDPSGDKLNLGRKPGVRSISRASDHSGGLPDLEMEDGPDYGMEFRPSSTIPNSPSIQRTRSLEMSAVNTPIIMDQSMDVMERKQEVLKDIDEHRQQIKDAKAWIQNGLMTVVGVGVMAYLQTLEQMGGS